MNFNAFFADNIREVQTRIVLSKPISAIQLLPQENGLTRLGLLSEIGSGETLEVCGDGFNNRTAKVRVNGSYYFVFLQDITPVEQMPFVERAAMPAMR